MQNLMPPVDTPDNLFHDGDPTQGIEGTIVEAEWMNNSQGATRDVQQEIINVLTAAGITPDPANQSQLLLALQQMISGDIDVALEGVLLAVNNLSEIAVGGESAQEQTRINIGCGTAATHDAEDFLPSNYQPPAAPVTSVNGETGAVELAAGDVDAFTKAESDARYLSPSSGVVMDVQFGAEVSTDRMGEGDFRAPAGHVLTGCMWGDSNGPLWHYKPQQKLINGIWVTVGG